MVSSGATTIQALTSGVAGSSYQTAPGGVEAGVCVCAWAFSGIQKPSTKAPCAAATVARNSRRVTSVFISIPHQIGGAVNGVPDAVIRAASAGVCDLGVDFVVGGVWSLAQERHRSHEDWKSKRLIFSH